MRRVRPDAPIERIDARAFRIPTDRPESDGTFAWRATTLVVVHVTGGGRRGMGYTYGSEAIVTVVRESLADRVVGLDAMAVEAAWQAAIGAVRNIGRPGIAATAISALDAALWDLKARLLDLPLVTLLGSVRDVVPVYGSGGFTSYSTRELCDQMTGWVEHGITRVKMKIGRSPDDDGARVAAVRKAIGPGRGLMVDANGAYTPQQASRQAEALAAHDVSWLEEPVSSDDLEGLRYVREHVPAGLQVAAGEYGYDPWYFRRLLEAGAIDVLQADATRCLGITGFLAAARLCEAFHRPLSAHTAPALHLHVSCAAPPLEHVEYFHDHARLEAMLFDGAEPPRQGSLRPDRSRPGLGLDLKEPDAARFAA